MKLCIDCCLQTSISSRSALQKIGIEKPKSSYQISCQNRRSGKKNSFLPSIRPVEVPRRFYICIKQGLTKGWKRRRYLIHLSYVRSIRSNIGSTHRINTCKIMNSPTIKFAYLNSKNCRYGCGWARNIGILATIKNS